MANVTYSENNSAPITKNFRYAEAIAKDSLVHIAYNLKNPEFSALKEDAEYFKYSLHGLACFIILFGALCGLVFFVDSKFKKII